MAARKTVRRTSSKNTSRKSTSRKTRRDPTGFLARRAFPRLALDCDAYYESDDSSLFARRIDVGLRGAFFPSHLPDAPGTRGTLRLDLGGGELVRARAEVLRTSEAGRAGMALKFVEMDDVDRRRLAAFLIEQGGTEMIPSLQRRFEKLPARGLAFACAHAA